jgi:hypothetical protein
MCDEFMKANVGDTGSGEPWYLRCQNLQAAALEESDVWPVFFRR